MTRRQIALVFFIAAFIVTNIVIVALRRRARRAPAAPPASGGVTLMPGESMPFPIPPEIHAQLAGFAAQGAKIETRQGPIKRKGERFTREMVVTVNGAPYARFEIGWTE